MAWSERFRFDDQQSEEERESWALTMFRRSRLIAAIATPFAALMHRTYRLAPPRKPDTHIVPAVSQRTADMAWYALLAVFGAIALWRIAVFAGPIRLSEVFAAAGLGALTAVRVLVLIAIASAIWVPVGVYVGLRPHLAQIVQPVAQFLAAFPGQPSLPARRVRHRGVGSQSGHLAVPPDGAGHAMVHPVQRHCRRLHAAARNARRQHQFRRFAAGFGGARWRLPAVFPFYVTGAITASGGSWNASIVAEVVSWGDRTFRAHGLGAYIADATAAGNFHRIVVGIAVMAAFVTLINRLFWRRLYDYAERRYRLT